MPYDIQPMSISDYDQVLAFWRAQEGIGLNKSDERQPLADFLERNPGMSFIVRDASNVIAAVLCGHDGRRGYIHHLAVAPAHRNRGLGRMLVHRCLDTLKQHRIAKCNVFVYTANHDGQGFWESLGYRNRTDLEIMQRIIG
jgi:N-acetylglutamate synthase